MYKIAKETLMYRTVLWTLWEKERVGRFGKVTLKHVEYHVRNELPVQVRCAILDAWGWCTGTTQRDGVGREEGGVATRFSSSAFRIHPSFLAEAMLFLSNCPQVVVKLDRLIHM